MLLCIKLFYTLIWTFGLCEGLSVNELIDRTLDAGTYYIKQNDPRQAFTIVKRVISHPNASYSQKYRAYEGLAAIFNISRHVDIVDRTRMDIVRTDRQLEDLLRFLLQEDMPTFTEVPLDDIYANAFEARNLEEVLLLARAEQVRWHASRQETLMTHRASAIAYGQMAAYGAALDHFDLCEKSDDRLGGEEGRDCADKLEVTRQRQQAGPVAMIAELSSRVFAERTINAARVNFATMYELYRLLRQDKPVLTPTDRNRIMSIIFECRKYLYYNGWITPEEAVDNVEVLWKDLIAAKHNFATDTYRIFKKDVEFSEWRRNGSEYEFWKVRRELSQHTPNTCTASAECDAARPYVLRFVTHGMALTNFGHAQHDALWPFIVTYNIHKRFDGRPLAPIYVLDTGIFVLSFLRLAFPERTFVAFRRVEDVPFDAEEVIISGLGLTKYFDHNPIQALEMREVRRHMMSVCSRALDSRVSDMLQSRNNKIRVLVIERNLTKGYQSDSDGKVEQDCQDDHPALKHYVDGGLWSQSVICSKRVLGSARRSIKNFEEVVGALRRNLPDYVEVVPFNPETYSYCDQVLMFANSKVAIGQHGAGLSLIGYMPPGSVVFELENILNSIFHHIAEGSGIQYVGFHMYNSSVYTTGDRAHVSLNSQLVVDFVKSAVVKQ